MATWIPHTHKMQPLEWTRFLPRRPWRCGKGGRRYNFCNAQAQAAARGLEGEPPTRKLGFRHEKDIEFAGLPQRFYRLGEDGWQKGKAVRLRWSLP